MSHRRAPRPAGTALRTALQRAAPQTKLAAVQAAWEGVVGQQIAAVAKPTAEYDEAVIVHCADPVWAQELDLMQDQLLERLRQHLGDAAPKELRIRIKDPDD
jgi:predicted nucleic acid-binding Zn ribbon protein